MFAAQTKDAYWYYFSDLVDDDETEEDTELDAHTDPIEIEN